MIDRVHFVEVGFMFSAFWSPYLTIHIFNKENQQTKPLPPPPKKNQPNKQTDKKKQQQKTSLKFQIIEAIYIFIPFQIFLPHQPRYFAKNLDLWILFRQDSNLHYNVLSSDIIRQK